MQHILVFDVDGTLTDARKRMDGRFAALFRNIVERFSVYLVTGSDYPKLIEQVPGDILHQVEGVFCCSGNELWKDGRALFSMNHSFPDELVDYVMELVDGSPFGVRVGNHVERRAGTLNISVVGRNAGSADRAAYAVHDLASGERDSIARKVEEAFPQYEAHRGGQISVDITPRGWNKGRLASELLTRYPGARISFFGDRISGSGNDRPLADALRRAGGEHAIHEVEDVRETAALLEALASEKPRSKRVRVA
ncbi:MAG: HAD-IIB family hydrolase [Rhizobiaceae bacterium]